VADNPEATSASLPLFDPQKGVVGSAAAAAPGNRSAYNLQKGSFIAESIKKLSRDRTA